MQTPRLFWDTNLGTAPHPSVLLLDAARPYSRASKGNPATTEDTAILNFPEVCFCKCQKRASLMAFSADAMWKTELCSQAASLQTLTFAVLVHCQQQLQRG